MIREIEADAKTFGAKDPRRTLIQEERRVSLEVKVVDEPVTVIVSQKSWVIARSGHGLDPAVFTFKPGDGLLAAYECRSVDQLVVLGSNGRAYSSSVGGLPTARGTRGDKAEAVPVTSLVDVEAGSQIASMIAGPVDLPLLIATTAGHGFVCRLGDLVGRNRGGKAFVAIGGDDAAGPVDRPLPMTRVDVAGDHEIACLSSDGTLLVFPSSEIKKLSGGGRGITLQDLAPGAQLASALSIGPKGVVVVGHGRGGREVRVRLTDAALEPHRGKRARKGRKLDQRIQAPTLVKPDVRSPQGDA